MAAKPDVRPEDAPVCLQCAGWNGGLQRYEHDGKVDSFHDVCVGVWLMANPGSVIGFFLGMGSSDAPYLDDTTSPTARRLTSTTT